MAVAVYGVQATSWLCGARLLLSELAAWRRDNMMVRQKHVCFAGGLRGLLSKLHVLGYDVWQ